MDKKQDIPSLLEALRKKEIKTELYELIARIANQQKISESTKGFVSNFHSTEDNTIEFIIYLKENSGLGDIRTINDLNREFKKWLTKNKDPERYELWIILSKALLDLEKENKCERDEESKKFNNNNATQWFLKGKGKQTGDISTNNPAICQIQNYHSVKRKSDSKNQPRIIPPKSAKELVIKILEAADGKVSMSDIVKCASSKVLLTQIKSLDNSLNTNDNGNQEKTNHAITQDEKSASLNQLIINDIKYISSKIWNEITQIVRGNKKIKGAEIFCLYYLPTNLSERKINLEDFGPKSTVGDITNDIKQVLKKYLNFQSFRNSDDIILPIGKIRIEIISRLNEICSENGYKNHL